MDDADDLVSPPQRRAHRGANTVKANAVAGGEAGIDLRVGCQNSHAVLRDAIGNRLADRDLAFLITTVTVLDDARLQVSIVVVQHQEATVHRDMLEDRIHHATFHLLGLGGDESLGELGEASQDAIGLFDVRRFEIGYGPGRRGGESCSTFRLGRLHTQVLLKLADAANNGAHFFQKRFLLVQDDLRIEGSPKLENELAERHLVAIVQNGFEHRHTVYVSSVLALEIDQSTLLTVDDHLGVMARDTEILDHDVAVRRTAQNHASQNDGNRSLATFFLVCQLEHQEWTAPAPAPPCRLGTTPFIIPTFAGPLLLRPPRQAGLDSTAEPRDVPMVAGHDEHSDQRAGDRFHRRLSPHQRQRGDRYGRRHRC